MTPSELLFRLVETIGPYGTETKTAWLVDDIIGARLQLDDAGNYYHVIEGGNEDIVFAAHLDTVVKKETKPVLYVVKNKAGTSFLETDGKSILGADDRSGVALLCYMILNKIPGTYYFFVGEEVGCIGSKDASDKRLLEGKKAIIEFDRRGYDSVITHQLYGRTASDEFAWELARALNTNGMGSYKPDDGGIYTDSAQFAHYVPECTNISVGYFDQHSARESQDLDFLDRLGRALLSVDWESLPISRTPKLDDDDFFYDRGANKRYLHDGDIFTMCDVLEENPALAWSMSMEEVETFRKIILRSLQDDPKTVIELLAEVRVLADVVNWGSPLDIYEPSDDYAPFEEDETYFL